MKFKISKIQARDLVNSGTLLDAQDPGLKIKIGKYEFATERQTDAGINADFDEEFEMLIDDDDYDLNRIQIEVEALNVNLVGINTSLGKGSISIKNAVPKMNRAIVFSVELTYFSKKGNYRKGVVHMEGLLEKEGTKIVLDDIKKNTIKMYPLKIEIQNFKANNLVDTGGILDVQDPCLKIKLGNKEYLTERQQDAGTDADFQEKFDFEISREEYNNGIEIEIEALNVNKIGQQTHIGKSSISLKAAVPRINRSTNVAMDLTHYSKKGSYQQGVVIFEVKVITNEKESIFISMYNILNDMFSCCLESDTTMNSVYEPTNINSSSNQSNKSDSLYQKSRRSSLSNAQPMQPNNNSSTYNNTNNTSKNTNTISEAFFSPLHAVSNIVHMSTTTSPNHNHQIDSEPAEHDQPHETTTRRSSVFGFQKKSNDNGIDNNNTIQTNDNKRNISSNKKNKYNQNNKESVDNNNNHNNNKTSNSLFFNFDDVLSDVLGESQEERDKRNNKTNKKDQYSSPNDKTSQSNSSKKSNLFSFFEDNNHDYYNNSNNNKQSNSKKYENTTSMDIIKKKSISKNVGKVFGMNSKKGFSKLDTEY